MKISVKSDLAALGKHLKYNTPKAIARASQASVNRTAATLRTQARRDITDEVQPRRGGQRAIGDLILVRKATTRSGVRSQTAHIDFAEKGIKVEYTRRASVRKIRGKSGRYRVKLKGQTLVKAFKLGGDSKPVFMRSKGEIKRIYSHTLIQEATKAKVFDKMSERAPRLFIPQFLRLVDIFDGFDRQTNSSGRRR